VLAVWTRASHAVFQRDADTQRLGVVRQIRDGLSADLVLLLGLLRRLSPAVPAGVQDTVSDTEGREHLQVAAHNGLIGAPLVRIHVGHIDEDRDVGLVHGQSALPDNAAELRRAGTARGIIAQKNKVLGG